MNSRDIVLSRIRNALSDRPEVELPAPPEVWPATGADTETMVGRFADELAVVEGEFFRCSSVADAQKQIAAIIDELGCKTMSAVDRPLTRELTAALDADAVRWAPKDAAASESAGEQWNPPAMAQIQLGLVSADYLLADSGSCIVESNNPQERLMCYLPPNCLVVARADRLREHMPAVWKELAPRAAEPDRRGEFVVITGPSRTADIEKILILGVHGPKRLFVIVVDTE